MHREIIKLDFRDAIYIQPEKFARLASAIDGVNNNNLGWLLIGKDRIEKNLSNRRSGVKHANVGGNCKVLLKMTGYCRTESIISNQNIAAS